MEPVLVIHGIGNRDQHAWSQEVQELEERFETVTGNSTFQFIPVYWGDLAAHTENLDACMPDLEPAPSFSVPRVNPQNAKVTDLLNLINRLPAIVAAPIKAQLEAALNQVAGDAVRSYLAQQYQTARVSNRHMITTSLGDIMVYQRNQAAIQGRVWEVLKAFDVRKMGYGTSRKSVHVVAHSLGGVIAVDTIIRGKLPLHAKSLTTFGSQFPYFHLVDPRPTVPAYTGEPIVMPPQLKRWINLWEPLDPLSFVASKMFQLSSGKPVTDIQVHPEGGMTELLQGYHYTHGIYWQTRELLDALKENLLK
ncbi:hypothetical protein [Deinococcus cellulosilyticus]|uniref:Uncharacterized protein n=1 Tax=Deinococcus cellulosilyticus (strain DSM 18568 / NBRC 106333 / KACC 11606 / 5516J-15) TaxID=1223518 RepID=A0A511N168_DEIC1|nr:hypothetical protein [Deinococcus cellulosilyticus]GEM46201.1 hypothetical protein DC3_18360 [Deinococcus cellulosilyticus NBRC 106333 = KACC 11606]